VSVRQIARLPELIGSRRLSFIIIGLLAAYYVSLLIFSTMVHPAGVIGIAKTVPFQVLYIALFANLLACTLRRTPRWIRRCMKGTAVADDATPDRIIAFSDLSREQALDAAAKALEAEKYSLTRDGELAGGVRGRFGALGSLVSHWGMVIVLVGAFLSLNHRFVGEALVSEGDKFWGTAREYTSFNPPTSFRQNAPKVSFRVDKVEAEFWEDKLLFTKLAAQMHSPADSKGEPVVVRINEPIFSNWYTTSVRLTGYGFSPKYVLRNDMGKELESSWVNMSIFPPGSEDSFRVQMIPHRFYVKLYPDYRQKEGKPDTASMNLNNPVFHLKVASHKIVTFDGLLLPTQRADVEGYSLAFEGMKKWATVQVVKDAGYPAIFVGTLLICIGNLWRFVFFRRDIVAKPGPGGQSLFVYCRADSLSLSDRWAEAPLAAIEKALADASRNNE